MSASDFLDYLELQNRNRVGAQPAAVPQRSRGLLETANDTAIEVANSAAGIVGSITEFISPGNRVAQAIDEFIKLGEQNQSDVVKAEKQKFQQELAGAVDAGAEVGAVLDYVVRNPLLAASQAFGSFGPTGGAIKAAGLLAKGSKAAQIGAGAAIGGAAGGGDAAGSAFDLVMQTPLEALQSNPEFQDLVNRGASVDEAKQELASIAARKASIIPAIVGAGFGTIGFEKLLSGAGGYTGGVAARAVKGALSEGVQEGIEEGITSFAGQYEAAQYNPEVDPLKGVAGAAALGGILGAAPGGAIAAITPASPQRTPLVDPDAPKALADAIMSNPGRIDEIVARAQTENDQILGGLTELADLQAQINTENKRADAFERVRLEMESNASEGQVPDAREIVRRLDLEEASGTLPESGPQVLRQGLEPLQARQMLRVEQELNPNLKVQLALGQGGKLNVVGVPIQLPKAESKPDVDPKEAQMRIESAALAAPRVDPEEDGRQALITRTMQNIERRGGVASQYEADVLAEANMGQPYNRIDPMIGRPSPTLDQRLTEATGIAVGSEAGVGYNIRETKSGDAIDADAPFRYRRELQGLKRMEQPPVEIPQTAPSEVRSPGGIIIRQSPQREANGQLVIEGQALQTVDPETLSNQVSVVDRGGVQRQRMTKNQFGAMQKIAKLFNKEVVLFTGRDDDGFVFNDANDNRIFLNVDSQIKASSVLLHETLHKLKQQDGATYEKLAKAVLPLAGQEQQARFSKYYDSEGDGAFTSDMAEEMVADVFGSIASNPEILNDVFAEITRQNSPKVAQTLIQKILAVFNRMINALQNSFVNGDFETLKIMGVDEQQLSNLKQAVRQAAIDYAKQQNIDPIQMQGGVIREVGNLSRPADNTLVGTFPNQLAARQQLGDLGQYDIEPSGQGIAVRRKVGPTRPEGYVPDRVVRYSTKRYDAAFDLARSKKWKNQREFKLALQEGVQNRTNEQIKQDLIEDAKFALKSNANAVGWYGRTVTKALNVLSTLHPEIATDENKKFAFIWALAVTSNGLKVDKNFELANQAYEQFKATGKMPNNIGIGNASAAINDGLQMYNEIVEKFGVDQARKFMVTEFKVSEIERVTGEDVGGEFKDTMVRGAAILGPKIGNGFYSNLNKLFDQLTMDRWLMRTWGRLTGTLVVPDEANIATGRDRTSKAIKAVSKLKSARSTFEEMLGFDLSTASVDQVAAAIKKASQKTDNRAKMNKTGAGQELRKAGNRLAANLDAQKEAPSGPGERNKIRAVFAETLKELQQDEQTQSLNMSDLQALLWYAEKRLYDTAGTADDTKEGYEDDEAPDYANAAIKLALANGVDRSQIEGVANEDSATNARRADAEAPQGSEQAQGRSGTAEGFTGRERTQFVRRQIINRFRRSNRAGDEASSPAYTRNSGGNGKSLRVLGQPSVAVYSPTAKFKNALQVAGRSSPKIFETRDAEGFRNAIQESKNSSKFGAAVYVYSEGEYGEMRLFLTQNGEAGFALKEDGDIVSVFGSPKYPGAVDAMLQLAIQEGGRKLDAFDTVLVDLYNPNGFKVVAKTAWNNDYAPEGWDKGVFSEFNNGEPDVVFMVYDPDYFGSYTDESIDYSESYDDAVAAQQENKPKFSTSRAIQEVKAYASANNDSFFRTPAIKDTKDMVEIGRRLGLKIRRDDTVDQRPHVRELYVADFGQGREAYITVARRDIDMGLAEGDVYVNVGGLEPGDEGSRVYMAAGALAFNRSLKLVGDPDGITEAGKRRRLENMITLALKYGTTNFFEPHEDMKGWNGLQWRGDDNQKLAFMLQSSYAVSSRLIPEIKNVKFDELAGRFRRVDDESIVPTSAFADMAATARARLSPAQREGMPGSGTLRLGIIYKSLAGQPDPAQPVTAELSPGQSEERAAALRDSTKGIRASTTRSPLGFYSKLSQEVSKAPASLKTGNQWAQWVSGGKLRQLGVEQEEIDASGIKGFLKGRGVEPTSLEDVSLYLEQAGGVGLSSVNESAQDEENYSKDILGNAVSSPVRGPVSAKAPGAAQLPQGEYAVTTGLVTTRRQKIGAKLINSPQDAADALHYLSRGAVERFDAIVTDKKGKPLSIVGGFKGAVAQSPVYAATLIGEAIQVEGAANIWFVHNHPSGKSKLSTADVKLFEDLKGKFDGTGIEARDILAVAPNEWSSTVSSGVPNPLSNGATVPVQEREIVEKSSLSTPIGGPDDAKRVGAQLSKQNGGRSGVMLLDAQNIPIAYVPWKAAGTETLKRDGKLGAIYRAVSQANASSLILVDPFREFSPAQFRNLAKAFDQVDVRMLDVLQGDTSAAMAGVNITPAEILKSRQRQTETPEFKRWFGDSKVVDAEGKPLVVYHGTNADFSTFDPIFQGSSGQGSGEPGFFFEASADNAARYTRGVNNGNLMPVYLSLKNPLIVDQTESKYGYDGSYDRVAFSNFIDDALELGNDGLIFRDVLDRGKRSTQYVVFDPTQIKSATGNNGEFNPENPDIRYSKNRKPLEIISKGKGWFEAKVGARTVGKLAVWKDSRGELVPLNVFVSPNYRKRGVATALYQAAEEANGQKLSPAVSLSDDAFEFWKRYRGESVEMDLRHWRDELDGARAMWKGKMGTIVRMSGGTATIEYDEPFENGATQSTILRRDLNQALTDGGGQAIDFSAFDGNPRFSPRRQMMDALIYKLQDKNIDLKRVQEGITKAKGALQDEINAYQKEELYHGRAAKQSQDFLTKQLNPLLESMKQNKVGLEEFETYLWNRHAEERNIQIAKVNDRFPDGGSGIMTADAREYLANLDPAKRQKYEVLAARVDQMVRDNLQMMVDSGLETQETIDAMKGAYRYYVPLMRAESSSFTGRGSGYSIKGATTKRALGSDKPVKDVISSLADQREKIISRAEKARVGRALMGLALENPQDDFWFVFDPLLNKDPAQRDELRDQLESMGMDPDLAEEIALQPYEEYMGPNGKVARRPNRKLQQVPNAVAVRINGEDKYVVFNQENPQAKRMAESLSNLDAPRLDGAMGVLGQISRYFASINTQYNPVFGIVNLMRDTQGALVNLSSTKIAGEQVAVTKGILPAVKAIYQVARARRSGGIVQGEWADLYDRFQNLGAQTGYRDMFSTAKERTDEQLQAVLDPTKWQKTKALGEKLVFNWLSDYNETLENAVRLSAFKTALDKGLSEEQAASVAKNLTVNFNRKGQIGVQAGALYAFFNASVQGSARLVETLKGPAGKRIAGGGLLIGAAQTLMLAMAGFDDEEPPEYVRERNLVIPTGNGMYTLVPMPLGLHVIPNIGRIVAEHLMGRTNDNVTESLAKVFNTVVDAFNPVGSSTFAQTITPTFLDPAMALYENKDFSGKPIAREDFNPLKPTPGYTRARDNSIEALTAVSKAINWLTGGSDYTQGVISPTPDQLEYLIGQVTGGVGREVSKLVQVAETSVTGEELPSYKIPLLGRLYGDTDSQSSKGGQFYANLAAMNEHKLEIKGRIADGLGTMDYIKDNPEATLYGMADRVEQRVQELRRAKRDLKERGAEPDQIKRIEDLITQTMANFNEVVEKRRMSARQ